jgi:penicillin-binding protein 1A
MKGIKMKQPGSLMAGFLKLLKLLLMLLQWCWTKFVWIVRRVFRVKKELPWYKKLGWRVLHTFILFILFLILVDMNFLWLFGKSPKISQINNPKVKTASELYDADGRMIGKYFDENRVPVKYQDLSPTLIKTLIATEDRRFYEHKGIDIKATFSIFYHMLKGERRGGSTITQQLVKNLFKTRTNYSRGLLGKIPFIRTAIYKTKEWISAVKIEMFYSKEQILTMYFNTVDFGSNSYGIKTAARNFFDVKPKDLNVTQSALLIGILKAPTYYSPISSPERALERRNVVLSQMLKYKFISKNQYDEAIKQTLGLNYSVENNYDGEAPYFRMAVAYTLKEWLKEHKMNLYEDGLKIYTTIDSRMQGYAEKSVQEHMSFLQRRFDMHWNGENPWRDVAGNEIPNFLQDKVKKTDYYIMLKKKFKGNSDSVEFYLNQKRKMRIFTWKGDKDTAFSSYDSIKYYNNLLHAGFITFDPHTGFVKTYVGGINFNQFKFDHVLQSKRQPGSTFKAFVYAAAIDKGWAPCDKKVDNPVTVKYLENGEHKTWSPNNADWVFTGKEVTLKYAFAKSINSIAVQMTQEVGWNTVIQYAYKLGIRSKLRSYPSVCLGASDVSLFELVNAYCPLINDGYKVEPVLVTKIVNRKGRVLYQYKPKKERVLSEETAFLMTQMLLGGLHEPGGTTQALFEHKLFDYNTDFGGKTGTSSNHSDGWFVGVSPDLISGSWVGAESRSVHFRTTELGEGCKTALPIYGKFMEKIIADPSYAKYRGKFGKPKVKITKNYSCHTYFRKKESTETDAKAPDAEFQDLY